MAGNFFGHPRNSINEIFLYLDCDALLQMREVCKLTNDNVNVFMNNQNLAVSMTIDHQITIDCIRIIFEFPIYQHCFFWKFSLVHILKDNPNIDSFAFLDRIDLVTSEAYAKTILKRLKPNVSRAKFNKFALSHIKPQLAQECYELLDNKHIPKIEVDFLRQSGINFPQLLDFIQKSGPNHASMNDIPFISGATEFLIQLSSVVDTLTINRPTRENGAHYKIPLSLVEQFFNRRCSRLEMGTASSISLADAEKLIQLFHHMDKKVYFEFKVLLAGPIDIIFGMYKVNSRRFRNERVMITHFEIED